MGALRPIIDQLLHLVNHGLAEGDKWQLREEVSVVIVKQSKLCPAGWPGAYHSWDHGARDPIAEEGVKGESEDGI